MNFEDQLKAQVAQTGGIQSRPKEQQEGLVMKPLYDGSKFIPGTAIHVVSNGAKEPFYSFDYNCLVIKATPLSLSVIYVNDKLTRHFGNGYGDEADYSAYKTVDIPVELVAEGKLKIKFLGGSI